MKWIKFVLASGILASWIYYLSNPIKTTKSTVPPIGQFLHPTKGFWKNGSLREVEFGKIKSTSLIENATVTWDKRLVPHIVANNETDAFYIQGYTVASQRLWQMDMLARSATGRLAEILGTRMVDRDRQQRRLGMLYAAENSVKGWQQDSINYKYLKAYAQGVNDWIKNLSTDNYPIEYKVMGFAPEPWSDLKTAAVVKYMTQSLASREADLEISNTRTLLGDSMYNFLYPDYFESQSPIIPSDVNAWDYITNVTSGDVNSYFLNQTEMYRRSSELPPVGNGSNNWAVAGSKTKSGKPILCNDPHLRLTLPAIWFENHIQSPHMNCYGVSVPGIPGILIGFNDSIAWGETNVGHDVADWYKLKWTDNTKTSYVLDGKPTPVTYRYETIKIKDQPDLIDTVKYTAWGPIVSDTGKDRHVELAYHWIAHEIPNQFEMRVFLDLMKAKNYTDYYKALSGFVSPAQNFVFAARSGDIAITVNGRFPLKNKDQGTRIQDGSSSQNAWKGYIPYEHNPRVKNPSRGFVSSANQHSTDPSYPYFYNGEFDSFRGRTVNMELEKNSSIIPEEMMAMQNSTFNLKAADNLPPMLGGIDENKLTANQLALFSQLKNWNFKFDANSAEATAFYIWYRSFYRLAFDELYDSPDSNYLFYPRTFMSSILLKNHPTHSIFDIKKTDEVETARDILFKSFLFTSDSMQRMPSNARGWASYSKPRVQHMANLPGFSRENLPAGGSAESLNALNFGHGPSWKMVVDLGDTLKAYVIFPGGQSGNPGSKYYDNMIDDYVKGNYYKALFYKKDYLASILGTQEFVKK